MTRRTRFRTPRELMGSSAPREVDVPRGAPDPRIGGLGQALDDLADAGPGHDVAPELRPVARLGSRLDGEMEIVMERVEPHERAQDLDDVGRLERRLDLELGAQGG